MNDETQSQKRACIRGSVQESSSPGKTGIVDLPQELLAKVIGSEDPSLARWTALASVCKDWKETMQLVSLQEAYQYLHTKLRILRQLRSVNCLAETEVGSNFVPEVGMVSCLN